MGKIWATALVTWTAGILIAVPSGSAQTALPSILDQNHNAWFSYVGDHDVKGKWGFHFDGQWRRATLGTTWQQYQIRPGLNYRMNPNVLFTVGYVYTRNFPYGEYPAIRGFGENRFYQQLLWKHPLKRLTLLQRYRLEERLIYYPQNKDGSATYQNRFRYQLKAEIPVMRDAEGQRRLYIAAFDEILLGVPPNYGPRVYDHNRVFAGLGWPVGKFGNMEAGYMMQYLGQRNGRIWEMNHTLFVTIVSNYSLSKYFKR